MAKSLDKKKSALLWQKILSEAENLPVLPAVVNKVLEEIDSPHSNPKVFQDIISRDPVLTAKVLKMSNSAYYGYSREIDTISEAVIILGLDTLKSLAIAASAYKLLNQPFEGYGLSKGGLWSHSLATAIAARVIAKSLNHQDTEKCFVAGLLHDIGKILLDKFLGDYTDDILTLVKMREISFDVAESQVLGFNHCDVGAELAGYWKLPNIFVETSKYHHTIYKVSKKNEFYIKIIHAADMIAYNTKVGTGVDANHYKTIKKVFTELKIDNKSKKNIIKKVRFLMMEFEKTVL